MALGVRALDSSDSPLAVARAQPMSDRYARYVLGVLFVVYVFNFIDRQILAILLQPIKQDLHASDTAMGFLTGFAFALFYAVAGIPIARLADRRGRSMLIAAGLAVWSAMTAASGLAQTFTQLALARFGVGVGEAAGSPPAHSLIADYFSPRRRASAMAIYSSGLFVGVLFGYLIGGWINEFFGWRRAFFVVGLPGLAMALIVRLTVRDPPRGYADGLHDTGMTEPAAEVFRFLWRLRSFRHLSLAAALHAFASYGLAAWAPAFLMRVHAMGTGEVGTWLGPIAGLAGGTGTILGGFAADRLAARDVRWNMWLPAIGVSLALPFSTLSYLSPQKLPALLFLVPATFFGAMWFGPTMAMTQSLVKLRMRALASAMLLFVISLIGLGLGPLAVGVLSDLLAGPFGAQSIRYALLLAGVANVGAALHYVLAARTLRQDLQAKGLPEAVT
jgi:MFS family permease